MRSGNHSDPWNRRQRLRTGPPIAECSVKLLWSNPEGRILAAKTDTMILHVGRVPLPTPPVGAEVPAELEKELRPIDWAAANRIVGVNGVRGFVESLVGVLWAEVSKVALIYANNPDRWPARSTFRDDAAARGTVRASIDRSSPMTPLERLGFGDLYTHDLSMQVKTGGKFASLEELAKRVPRISLDYVRRQIIEQIIYELTTPGTGAMFFAKTHGGMRFHGTIGPVRSKDDDDGYQPGIRSRYRT
jgi:hypothetical protein